MKRRSSTEESSLELLLDTICNTFGGILFISLLVVILLNTTSEATRQNPPSNAAQASMIQASIERDELTQELSQLKAAVSQQRAISGAVVSEDVVRLASRLKEQRANYQSMLVGKSRTVGDLTKAQSSINKSTREAADVKSKVADAQIKVTTLEHILNQKLASKSLTAPMPKVRHASTEERVFYLRGGKLFGPHLDNGVLNTSDFVEVQRSGETVLEVNPRGGTEVDADGKNTDALVSRVKGLDPSKIGAKVFVWPDSYKHFDAVRLAFGAVNIGYELIPVDDGAIIRFGPGAGSGMNLQ